MSAARHDTLRFDLQLQRGDAHFAAADEVAGAMCAVWGPSGAGKTTLLRCIGGFEPQASGRVIFGGEVLSDSDRRTFLPPHRRGFGVCFQESRLLPHLSVTGNLRYGLGRKGCSYFAFDDIVERLRIAPLLGRRVRTLSGGEARRVALGRALLSARRMLLVDEPFTGLDAPLRNAVMASLKAAREHMPVLLVTHRLAEALALCDRLLLMREGRLVAAGALEGVLEVPEALALLVHGGLMNTLTATVRWNDTARGVTECLPAQAGAVHLTTPPVFRTLLQDKAPGEQIRLALHPRDITLAPRPLDLAPFHNQLEGIVARVLPCGDDVFCWVDVGARLLVQMPAQAYAANQLKPGAPVWCLFRADHVSAA